MFAAPLTRFVELGLVALIIGVLVVIRFSTMRNDAVTLHAPRFLANWEEYDVGNLRLGPGNAPNHLIVFSDYDCPHCGTFSAVVDTVRADLGDSITVLYRHVLRGGTDVQAATTRTTIAECAALDGRFEIFHRALFSVPTAANDPTATRLAQLIADEAGIAMSPQFTDCVRSGEGAQRLVRDDSVAAAIGVVGTPTWVLNGVVSVGSVNATELLGRLRDEGKVVRE